MTRTLTKTSSRSSLNRPQASSHRSIHGPAAPSVNGRTVRRVPRDGVRHLRLDRGRGASIFCYSYDIPWCLLPAFMTSPLGCAGRMVPVLYLCFSASCSLRPRTPRPRSTSRGSRIPGGASSARGFDGSYVYGTVALQSKRVPDSLSWAHRVVHTHVSNGFMVGPSTMGVI